MNNQPAEQHDEPIPEVAEASIEPPTHPVEQSGSMQEKSGPLFSPPTPPTTPPKKSHKKRNILIAVAVIVILLIAAGVAVYWFSQPKQSTTKVTKPVVVDSAQSIIAKINTQLTDKTAENYRDAKIDDVTPVSNDGTVYGPAYKAADTDYYVTTTDVYQLTISKTNGDADTVDADFNESITSQIKGVFSANKYASNDYEVASEYQSDSVICTLSPQDSEPITVACSNKDAYTKLATDLKPYITAYLAGSKDTDSSQMVFSEPTVKDSTVKGYQKATMQAHTYHGIGGAALLFYRKADATWQFFMATQNILSCSEYATADQVAAFTGDPCIDSNDSQSTVGTTPTSTAIPSDTTTTTPAGDTSATDSTKDSTDKSSN